jgi:2-(1,2-epoxy-1,2-dihydrophenyl)acetyl-CoA isomerase
MTARGSAGEGAPRVILRDDGPVAWVVLNRPAALNAFDLATVQEFGAALDACTDDRVRVVVVTGAGSAFCAGGDVREFVAALDQDPAAHLRGLATAMHRRMILPIRRLPKPVLASINGTAAGGGLSLALACDLRIAAVEARLTMAYSNIGLSADGGSSYVLPRLVGTARAAELLLLADAIDGRRALELGLVNRVVPAAELAAATAEWAARLAARPSAATAEIKALLAQGAGNDLETQLEAEVASMASLAATADFREGVRAFAAKREPRFGGLEGGQ